MKHNNHGNIKLVSLLFLLGCGSAVLLIPAVVQKETISSATGSVIAKKDVQSPTDSLMAQAENIKKEYIEVPVTKVVETTNEITKYIKEPQKIIVNAQTQPNEVLGNSSNISTSPQVMMKITKEMVDNCRIITDQYNKVTK